MVAMKATAFVVVLVVTMEYSATMAIAERASVSIHNDVDQDIEVNCPGHNAFGQITMLPNQYFGWDFKPNIWGTTRYTCSFRWGLKWRQFYVFVDDGVLGYVTRRPCTHCVWWVGRAGFWMTDLYERPVFWYRWE